MKIIPAISVIVYISSRTSSTCVTATVVVLESVGDESSCEGPAVTSTQVTCIDDSTTDNTIMSSTSSDTLERIKRQRQQAIHTEAEKFPSVQNLQLEEKRRFEYARPSQYMRHFLKYFLWGSSPSLSKLNTQNRFIKIKGHDRNIELSSHACQNDSISVDDGTCSTKLNDEAYYELVEPLHLELGGKIFKYVEDYAYSPVVVTTSTNQQPQQPSENSGSTGIVFDNHEESKSPQRHPDDDSLEESPALPRRGWWQWWIPWKILRDRSSKFNHSYKMNDEAFAGGSHGEIWRGRRKCVFTEPLRGNCSEESLIFKRLKVEKGFRALEAGLREIHFGTLLRQLPIESNGLFTQYIEHFFGNDGELWIVFADHGLSLRSFLYTSVDAGGFVVFQQSWLWTLMRVSLHSKLKPTSETNTNNNSSNKKCSNYDDTAVETSQQVSHVEQTVLQANTNAGRDLIRTLLKQILQSVKVLHDVGIVHRDIKPSNIICKSNIALDQLQSMSMDAPQIQCVLGDFSSAYDDYSSRNLYTRGPSRLEQTNEYAPPEAIFGDAYNNTSGVGITPSFDSWSIGIVALEILLGTPNVFSVDQRTRMVLSYKMKKKGASDVEIERAIYLAALSQFCIYNPMDSSQRDWPLRDGDPLHQSAMTKQTCTMTDFQRALRARDPLGWGFELSGSLLHLIWKLLEWEPQARLTAADALNHPYFTATDGSTGNSNDPTPGDHNALESQMLDPGMDFNVSDTISEFVCPKCGRIFSDWRSCHTHTNSRKHGKFCVYDRSTLPTCLNSHAMLPAHSYSGYCDIQGRRRTIEDFHAIHLLPNQQFYGIFDGHLGNFASKYAASFLYDEVAMRLVDWSTNPSIKSNEMVSNSVTDAFTAVHEKFLAAITTRVPPTFMDQSGTTATALLVTNHSIVVMSIGDSRAVLSTRRRLSNFTTNNPQWDLVAHQLTKDHVASDPEERDMVERRGGQIIRTNGMERVMGSLIVTRSIGDPNLAPYLSRIPHLTIMSKDEVLQLCGNHRYTDNSSSAGRIDDDDVHASHLCYIILASDGLWDTVSNQEAVDMVETVVNDFLLHSTGPNRSSSNSVVMMSHNDIIGRNHWFETAALQQAAEALTHEAYVRGSTDNIGVCIVAIS